MRRVALLAVLLAAPSAVAAQSSVYGVLGLGLPGRPVGIQARAMGGGIGAVDPASPVNPAAVVAFGGLSAVTTMTSVYRSYSAGAQAVSGLRDTRFPGAVLAGPVPGTQLTFALSYVGYADRTFDVQTSDTVVLRNEAVAVDDRARSIGGVVDVRAALGWNPRPRVWLGAAVHILSGSTREDVGRSFGDSAYASVAQTRFAGYSARGVSVGTLVTPANWLRIGLAARQDFRLNTTASLFGIGDMDLPFSVTAGALMVPAPAVRVGVTGTWARWSRADDDLAAFDGGSAFDTYDVGAGVELGGLLLGGMPVRLGARHSTLPFSPTDDQPSEVGFSGGTALIFAGGLAAIDLALERVRRDGAGVSERAWQISVGLRVRP